MTAALKTHRVLRRRRTRTGWVDLVEQVLETAEADTPEPVDAWDATWAPGWGPRPTLASGCWLDGPWPRHGPTPTWWGRGYQVELGTRSVGALIRENRKHPAKEAA